jgi:hypothetical protein
MFVVDSFFIAVLSVDVIYELTYTAGIKEMFVNVVTFLFKIREMEKKAQLLSIVVTLVCFVAFTSLGCCLASSGMQGIKCRRIRKNLEYNSSCCATFLIQLIFPALLPVALL